MNYLDEIQQYYTRMGGEAPFKSWVSRQDEDVQRLATKAVIEHDVDAWNQFKEWNKNQLWEKRAVVPEEMWAKVAASAGLPLEPPNKGLWAHDPFGEVSQLPNKVLGAYENVATDANFLLSEAIAGREAFEEALDNPDLTEPTRKVISSIAGAMEIASRGKEMLGEAVAWLKGSMTDENFSNLALRASKNVRDIIKKDPVGLTPPYMAARVLDDVLSDFWSTADLLAPDVLQRMNRDPILRMGLAGPVRSYLDFIDTLGAPQEIKRDIAAKRRAKLLEQGVPEEYLKIQDGAVDFAALAAEFLLPTGTASIGSAVHGFKLRKALDLLAKQQDPVSASLVVQTTEKLAKAMASRGGLWDEAGKGAFVGFVHTDGDVNHRLQESLIWSVLGAGMGGLATTYRFLTGMKAEKEITGNLLIKAFSSEESLSALAGDSREAVAQVYRAAVSKNVPRGVVKPLYPTETSIEVLEQYAKLADQLDDMQKPMELRVKEYQLARQLEAELAEQPYTPIPTMEIEDLLRQQDMQMPMLKAELENLVEKNPRVFFPAYNTEGLRLDTIPAMRESVSYLNEKFPLDARVVHRKYGEGTITQVVGTGKDQRATVDFGTWGKKTLAPAEAWRVKLPREMQTSEGYYDQLVRMVETGEVSVQRARQELLRRELANGDSHARYEVINGMLDVLFAAPERLHQYPKEFQKALVDYLRRPDGSHPYFQWMDDAQVLKQVKEKGFAVSASLPYHLWEWVEKEAGKGFWKRLDNAGPLGILDKRLRGQDGLRKAILDHKHRPVSPEGLAGIRLRNPVMGVKEGTRATGQLIDPETVHTASGTMTSAGWQEGQMVYMRVKNLESRPYQRHKPEVEFQEFSEPSITQELEALSMKDLDRRASMELIEGGGQPRPGGYVDEGMQNLRLVDEAELAGTQELPAEELIRQADDAGAIKTMLPEVNVTNDYGYTSIQMSKEPWGDGAIMTTAPTGFYGMESGRPNTAQIAKLQARLKKELTKDNPSKTTIDFIKKKIAELSEVPNAPVIGGKLRHPMKKGISPQQLKKAYNDLAEFMSNPENWQLVRPSPRPSRFSNESARALDAYLKSAPPWGKFGPLQEGHNLAAMTNRGVVFGIPEEQVAIEVRGGGWYKVGDKLVRGKQSAEELALPQPNDVLQDVALSIDYPTHSISIIKKKPTGEWEIVAGLGEENTYRMLKQEVEEELGELGISTKDSLYGRTLRAQIKAHEEARSRVKNVQVGDPEDMDRFRKFVTPRVATKSEKMIAELPIEWQDTRTGLMKREYTLKAVELENLAARDEGVEYGVAVADISDVRLMDFLGTPEEAAQTYKAAVKALRRVADKHGVHIGHWSEDKFAVFGRAKDPDALVKDLHAAFRNMLNDSPGVAKILYSAEQPMIVMPSVGMGIGKGVHSERLFAEATARLGESANLNKAARWAHGFFTTSDLKATGVMNEGPYKGGIIYEGNTGVFIASPKTSEFWEQVAYAKIVREGGKVKIKNGKLSVVVDGKVAYTADNMRQLAIIEQIREPAVATDLTQEVMHAFAGGYPAAGSPADIAGIVGREETLPYDAEPAARGAGEMFSYYWRKTRTLMLDIEKRTKFPSSKFYDRFERGHKMASTSMNAGLRAYDKAMRGVNNNKARDLFGQILLKPGHLQHELVEGLTDKGYLESFKKVQDVFFKLYDDMGIPKEIWPDVPYIIKQKMEGEPLPQILERLGHSTDDMKWANMLIPAFRAYELKQWGQDSTQIFHKLARAHFKAKYVVPHKEALRQALADTPASELSGEARAAIQQMEKMFLGAIDGDFLSFSAFVERALGGSARAQRFAQQLPALALSLQYSSSLGFRVGLPFRNLFQPIMTTAPIIGLRDTLEGWHQAMKVLMSKDKEFKALFGDKMDLITLKQQKFLGTYLEQMPVVYGSTIEDAALAREWVGKVHKFTTAGLKMQQLTDRLNRMAAFLGGINHAQRPLQKALKEGKDFEWFARRADLNMFHELDVKRWKEMWDKAHRGEESWRNLLVDFGKRVADDTQFEYASYAQPRVFHNQLTKMFAQYGVWPVSYFDLIKERGIFNSQAKMRFWRRLIGIHGSIAAAGAATGATVMDWVFLYPLNYSGGPFFQWGVSTLEALQGPESMRQAKIARASKRMGLQMLPLGGLIQYDVNKGAKYLAQGDGVNAVLSMFRLTDWPEEWESSRGGRTRAGRKRR